MTVLTMYWTGPQLPWSGPKTRIGPARSRRLLLPHPSHRYQVRGGAAQLRPSKWAHSFHRKTLRALRGYLERSVHASKKISSNLEQKFGLFTFMHISVTVNSTVLTNHWIQLSSVDSQGGLLWESGVLELTQNWHVLQFFEQLLTSTQQTRFNYLSKPAWSQHVASSPKVQLWCNNRCSWSKVVLNKTSMKISNMN